MNTRKDKGKELAINRIAEEVLNLETLETRMSDSLDFSDQAVWTLKAALEAAFEAGQNNPKRETT